MKVTVRVTEEMADRRNGPSEEDPDFSSKCMIAQALAPLLKEDVKPYVAARFVQFLVGGEGGYWYDGPMLPKDVIAAIDAYDVGLVVSPFTFEADLPAAVLRDPERK